MTSRSLVTEEHDKKAIKRFYSAQKYPAKFKGFDVAFVVKDEGKIVACALISRLRKDNTQALLHAVVVEKSSQGKGLAKRLLGYAIRNVLSKFNHDELNHRKFNQVVCFSRPELTTFYLRLGFNVISESDLNVIMRKRFQAYRKSQPNLIACAIAIR